MWLAWLIAMAFAIVIVVLVNMWWVDSRTRPAAARDGGSIVETDVVPANVKVEGEGPPVLLIHGFAAAIDWWDEIAPALAKQHRVIRLDLIGHGGTAAPRDGYSIERQAELAAAVLDKLGVDRVTVIGHSMGGEVAVALAARRPERINKLVLIDSPPTAGGNFSLLMRAYLTPGLGELLAHFETDAMLRRGLAQGFAPGFVVPEKFVADVRQLTYTAFRSAHDQSEAYRTAKAPYERLSELKAVPPVLVIFGSLDAIVQAGNAKLFERVPGAKVVTIDGVGHSPLVEKPDEVEKLLGEFLDEGVGR
jgi:pimeloyl-ACP methyl ester carboxylesterase